MKNHSVIEIVIILISISSFQVIRCCQVQLCSNEYSSLVAGHRELQKLQMRDIKPRTSDRLEYCNLLHAYNHCLKSLSRSCRGKLDYHAVLALVRKWIDENQCPKNDHPGFNHRSRQAIRSGTFISNLPLSNNQPNHEESNDNDGETSDEDDHNSEEISSQINVNQESTEVRRRGKSSQSHHPQCILYAPSLTSSSSGQQNYLTSMSLICLLYIITFLNHKLLTCR